MYAEAHGTTVGERKTSSSAWLFLPLTTALIALTLAVALPFPAGADIGTLVMAAPQPGL